MKTLFLLIDGVPEYSEGFVWLAVGTSVFVTLCVALLVHRLVTFHLELRIERLRDEANSLREDLRIHSTINQRQAHPRCGRTRPMNTPKTQPPAALGAAPCSPDWRSIADDLAALSKDLMRSTAQSKTRKHP